MQAASAFAQTELTLSSETVAEILTALRERRERESPRSLRFCLTPGKRPSIFFEPWGIEIAEPMHVYGGTRSSEIRVWGRRRLLTLEALLPLTDSVEVRLLGTGMPSYWSITHGQHRFDLGLSGWTRNDWAGGAAFDELVSAAEIREGDVKLAAHHLQAAMAQTPKTLAAELGIDRKLAQAALQKLCARGLAMFDAQARCFRWRPLFEGMPKGAEEQAQHMATAQRLLAANAISALDPPTEQGDDQVWNLLVSGRREQQVEFRIDADGKLQDLRCSCSIFRRNKLRKGACPHVLAGKLYVMANT